MEEEPLIYSRPGSDEDAFRTIVDAYTGAAMALAINLLGNRDDAEDVCQETFIQVFRRLDSYDRTRSFRTWFYTILYRRCLDHLKRRRRSRALLRHIERDPVVLSSTQPACSSEAGGLPAGLLDRLKMRERTALCLWANDGYTAKEISEVLRCTPGTARVYLFQARKKIKKLLEKDHAFLQSC
jgi:RNA polymerase sigma-70 factor (ECF subfamily)